MASTIKEALKRIRERYEAFAVESLVAELAEHGERILQECAEEIEYRHQTYNLIDSYGYGVYYNGELKRFGFVTPNQRARERKGDMLFGRDIIKQYLDDWYIPEGTFDLVVVATMPYAYALEKGTWGGKKYRVISGAYDKLKALRFPSELNVATNVDVIG